MQITVVHHPLLQVKMSVLRDLNTNCPTFRRVIGEVAMLLTFEATKNIPLETHTVTTPLAETCALAWAFWRACSACCPRLMWGPSAWRVMRKP